ncbi:MULTISPECIES: hypothetical protein [Siphonobacter]|uniref:Uncharacterized protein n=1 Tax=Siphonobacter curvatus TaxID=2094562 RepID=A0A2S7IEK2_9BACT|nr:MULTISPECIES: hypothetical protein [Siphonobacter]PQA52868.1 hypothetical protein C5O19_25670 [Siphonobacter curvatus]
MKVLTMLGFMVMAAFLGITLASTQQQLQPINTVLGDESFIATYGRKPDLRTPQSLRIETHLAYVEDKLRQSSVTHLPAHLQQKRQRLLDLLQQYREAGNFPQSEPNVGQYKPCFMDKNGTICAVGYLIEQTEGRAIAERINARHPYDYIQDMDMPEVQEWIESSGLTEEEYEMIQTSH